MRQKIDPYVYEWCAMRCGGAEFNASELYAYVRTCCEVDGLTTREDSIRRAMSALKNAGVVDYQNTNKRRGTYVVTAARGLDYVPPVEPAEQLDLLGGAA